MSYLVICVTSFLISFVTLFSGFGLGTVLMPVFALFFPLPIAIASTALIHLANNLFKFILVGKFAKWKVVLIFGIPAALASAWGAYLLGSVATWPSLTTYQIGDREFKMTVMGLTVGLIVMASSLFELIPRFANLAFPSKYIPVGGALSGFFGGISGNQGILRSAFLIKSGLNKEEFIGTGTVCSIIVDSVRILIYGWTLYTEKFSFALSSEMEGILIAASLTAFAGAFIGTKLMDKITFKTIQILVGSLLLILGFAIAIGIA